jgi:hypothetical protein
VSALGAVAQPVSAHTASSETRRVGSFIGQWCGQKTARSPRLGIERADSDASRVGAVALASSKAGYDGSAMVCIG